MRRARSLRKSVVRYHCANQWCVTTDEHGLSQALARSKTPRTAHCLCRVSIAGAEDEKSLREGTVQRLEIACRQHLLQVFTFLLPAEPLSNLLVPDLNSERERETSSTETWVPSQLTFPLTFRMMETNVCIPCERLFCRCRRSLLTYAFHKYNSLARYGTRSTWLFTKNV